MCSAHWHSGTAASRLIAPSIHSSVCPSALTRLFVCDRLDVVHVDVSHGCDGEREGGPWVRDERGTECSAVAAAGTGGGRRRAVCSSGREATSRERRTAVSQRHTSSSSTHALAQVETIATQRHGTRTNKTRKKKADESAPRRTRPCASIPHTQQQENGQVVTTREDERVSARLLPAGGERSRRVACGGSARSGLRCGSVQHSSAECNITTHMHSCSL